MVFVLFYCIIRNDFLQRNPYFYYPLAETVLNAGMNQPLTVGFTSLDSTDYNNPPTKTVYINVIFLPNPNGYQFTNYPSGEHSLTEFINTYQLDSLPVILPVILTGFLPEIINSNPLEPLPYLLRLDAFYSFFFADTSNVGNCFGMNATSLLLYNNNINDLYHQFSATIPPGSPPTGKVSNWLKLTSFPYTSPPDPDIAKWISLYQPLHASLACVNYQSTAKDPEIIYNTLNANLPNGLTNMVLGINSQNQNPNGSLARGVLGHALVPYKITSTTDSTGDPLAIISVYDCNMPDNSNQDILIDKKTWTVKDYPTTLSDGSYIIFRNPKLYLTSLDSITKTPEIPQWYTILNMFRTNYMIANACYTDTSGNKLGYYNEVFYDQIPGTCPMIPANDNGNNSNATEAYYVPDPSIKMELFGNEDGNFMIGMGNPNGLIIANVTVTQNSVDEFKILNNGTGVYFNSENDTTQSLGLILDVETSAYAQIVNANLSQIEKGGYINLSNNNGTITLQNSGLPRTCNMFIENATNGQNSSINLTNIVIEGNSTLYINPSNWNDIDNSTVTINDVGSNGQTYYTEIITYKDGQVTQGIFPSAALTIAKSAYQ